MDEEVLTPERIAMLQMLLGGGVGTPAPPLEFSASLGGYMPPDLGSMGAYANQVQDWVALAPLLNAVSGLEGSTGAPQSGRMMLEAVLESTPPTSWENVLAQFLISGESPSTAIEKTLNTFADDPELQQFIPADSDQWRKDVASQAQTWFSGLMDDQVTQQSGAGRSEIDRALGLPDAGTSWSLDELNPALAGASEQYSTSRDEVLKLLGRDRREAASGLMGDEDAYRQKVMESYLTADGNKPPDPGPVVRSLPGPQDNAVTQALNSGDSYIETQESAKQRYLEAGEPFGPWGNGPGQWMTPNFESLPVDAADVRRRQATAMADDNRPLDAAPAGLTPRAMVPSSTSTQRKRSKYEDVMQSEISRDLSKARNNAYSQDYKIQTDTAKANETGLKDRDAARREALWAAAMNQVLTRRGLTPRSVAANRFLSAGQTMFGG